MFCPVCGSENPARGEVCFTCRALLGAITRGTVIASRYVVLRWLGQGAMGTVYEARDRILDEPVALKVIRVDPDEPPELARRFRSEIKLARKVTHPHVCRIYEYGEELSCRYISMELIEGMDLKRLVRERGPLSPAEAFGWPSRSPTGCTPSTGWASSIATSSRRTSCSIPRASPSSWTSAWPSWRATGRDGRPGDVVGTPEYMSPEQARGEPVDLRSDIYALGIVCHEIFTGAVPFRGSTPATTLLLQIQQPPPLDDARMPAALADVLRRALAKQASERYASAQEVADALREVRATLGGVPLPPPSPMDITQESPTTDQSTRSLRMVQPAWRWHRTAAVALVGALAASLAFWALERRSPVPAAEPHAASPTPAPPAPAPSAAVARPKPRPSVRTASAPPPSPSAAPETLPASRPELSSLTVEAALSPPPPLAPPVEEPGQLRVGVRPWAEVEVDGRSVGFTPLKPITLAPGDHTARLRHPAYPPVTHTVRIRAGETTDLIVDLRPNGMETEKN